MCFVKVMRASGRLCTLITNRGTDLRVRESHRQKRSKPLAEIPALFTCIPDEFLSKWKTGTSIDAFIAVSTTRENLRSH